MEQPAVARRFRHTRGQEAASTEASRQPMEIMDMNSQRASQAAGGVPVSHSQTARQRELLAAQSLRTHAAPPLSILSPPTPPCPHPRPPAPLPHTFRAAGPGGPGGPQEAAQRDQVLHPLGGGRLPGDHCQEEGGEAGGTQGLPRGGAAVSLRSKRGDGAGAGRKCGGAAPRRSSGCTAGAARFVQLVAAGRAARLERLQGGRIERAFWGRRQQQRYKAAAPEPPEPPAAYRQRRTCSCRAPARGPALLLALALVSHLSLCPPCLPACSYLQRHQGAHQEGQGRQGCAEGSGQGGRRRQGSQEHAQGRGQGRSQVHRPLNAAADWQQRWWRRLALPL